ncbi:hypothetical protein [Marinobacter sp. C18]|uniref:hypothetical protein n=1 Tax=Marinobacter sp. C18 TaxID=1772288 RepID=UPI000948E71F|nr:hypothetical protein [Marinobacter sp. C18]
MKQSARKKSLSFVHWLAGLCAVAGVIASLRGLYGMFQVWTGEITSVPIIGKLMYPSDTDSGAVLLISFFEVGFGGLAYLFMWVTPASMALVVLTLVADRLKRPRTDRLEPIQ